MTRGKHFDSRGVRSLRQNRRSLQEVSRVAEKDWMEHGVEVDRWRCCTWLTTYHVWAWYKSWLAVGVGYRRRPVVGGTILHKFCTMRQQSADQEFGDESRLSGTMDDLGMAKSNEMAAVG